MKKQILLAMIVLILFAHQSLAQESIPIPHGIDGYVLSMENGAQLPSGTYISINNTNSDFYYEGTTGRGPDSGKYSVALTGNDGDTIILTAKNAHHTSTRTVTLFGAMHDINIYLSTQSSGNSTNQPPVFTSIPNLQAVVGSLYNYDVEASDPESGAITYSLFNSPLGMAIDPTTGLITWVPVLADIGQQNLIVAANDGINTATQSFTIVVSVPSNAQPIITSQPNLQANAGSQYQYQITATDSDGDSLLYSLLQSPQGMAINTQTGLISWTPSNSQAGQNTVTLSVNDPKGGSTTQTFTITVASTGNMPPQIRSSPISEIEFGRSYSYYPDGYDPDGDLLTFSLNESPAGMTISQSSGLVQWIANQTGSFPVRILVGDPSGETAMQSFILAVSSSEESISRTKISGLVYGEGRTPASYGTSVLLKYGDSTRQDMTGNSSYPNAFSLSLDLPINSAVTLRAWNSTHLVEKNITISSQNMQVELVLKKLTNQAEPVSKEKIKATISLIRADPNVAVTQVSAESETSISFKASRLDDSAIPAPDNVFQYFTINSSTYKGKFSMAFKVSKGWVEQNEIDVFSITLRQLKGSWANLRATRISEDETSYYFEADAPSDGTFAITGEQQLPVQGAPIKSTFSINGILYLSNGKQAEEGTLIVFTNKDSGAVVEARTGGAGSFSVILEGAVGETIEVKAGEKSSASYSFKLGSSEGSLRLVYNQATQSLVPITGALVASSPIRPLGLIASIVLIVLIGGTLAISKKIKLPKLKKQLTEKTRVTVFENKPEKSTITIKKPEITIQNKEEKLVPIIETVTQNKESKQELPKQKMARPDQFFYLKDGSVLTSITELYLRLDKVGHGVYIYHVSPEKNDFANWVEGVFENKKLAEIIRACTSKEQLKNVLHDYLRGK
ncbi:MAG: putative Ig domain-containing protein [Nanoarchaeota archaeon]